MISLQMQGGCLCENQPGLRLDTTNVEIAATIAPRPLLMVSATGDWTTNTLEREYPAVRALYALQGAADRVHAVRFEAPHNYNQASREAVYAWMARWLQNAPANVRREERSFTPDPLPDLMVFYKRPVPQNAVDAAKLTSNWIAAARRQLSSTPLETRARALRHALGFGPPLPSVGGCGSACSRGEEGRPAPPGDGDRRGHRCRSRERDALGAIHPEARRLHAVRRRRSRQDPAFRYLQPHCSEPTRCRHRRSVARHAGRRVRGIGRCRAGRSACADD